MFGLKKLTCVAPAIGLMAFSAMPAGAQVATAGTVAGQVTLTPALNVTPSTTSFAFQSTSITGAFVQVSTDCAVATGTVGVSANGNSLLAAAGGETLAFGVGTVNSLSGNGSGTCEPSGLAGTVAVNCNPLPTLPSPVVNPVCGVYVRVAGLVLVGLDLSVNVNGQNHVPVAVGVAALFTPNGVLPPYSSASFTGAFAGAGV